MNQTAATFAVKDKAIDTPLVRYLGDTLRVCTELIIPATSGELEDLFHRGEFDLAEGGADARRVRLVWESPPYADYVWAVPARLPVEVRVRLRDAFLALDNQNPAHEKIMTPLGARAHVPAARSDFNLVRQVVTGQPGYSRP